MTTAGKHAASIPHSKADATGTLVDCISMNVLGQVTPPAETLVKYFSLLPLGGRLWKGDSNHVASYWLFFSGGT